MKKTITILSIFFLSPFIYAQISTTKIVEIKEEIPTSIYDSLQNFLDKDVYKYIGQELYVKGEPENVRKYGYRGFFLDYNKSTSDKSNIYKCGDSYNSKYDELFGKYFSILAVHKHPQAKANEYLYGSKYYLELKEKNSGDKVYFEYDTQYENSFPFIVVGFFEKAKKRVVGEKFVFCNKALDDCTEIKTGKPITKKHGEKWECTDLTVEEKYCSLSMVIKNSLNEKTTITYDYCFNEYSKGRVYFAKDASLYRKKFGDVNWFKVLDGKVVVGFTQEMTLLAWGKPDKINKASYGSQWVYENQYLYFKNGKLISFN